MGELQTIETNNMPQIKMWNGQRVVTFKDIDEVHGRPSGTAKRNFGKNKKRFIAGIDYYELNQRDEIRPLGIERPQGGTPNSVTLVTETGYLMIVKSFKDDLSWAVQRELVNNYFRVREPAPQIPEKTEEKDISDEAFKTIVQRKQKKKVTFYEANETKIDLICKNFNLTRKELYHKMYNYISLAYNFEAANNLYEEMFGVRPEYTMDLLDEFPPLWNMGDSFLIGLVREIRR